MSTGSVDVLIVGGGPAGAAAATVCASAGLDVVMVEPGNASRRTPCESVHPGVASLLNKLGIADFDNAVRGRYCAVVANGRRHPFGQDGGGAWQGFHLDRVAFDEILRGHACGRGAEVAIGARAKALWDVPQGGSEVVLDTGRTIHARWLVDASGPWRWLSRKLDLRQDMMSPPLTAWRGEAVGEATGLPADAIFVPEPSGWTWTAPMQDGRIAWTRLSRRDAGFPRVPPELAKLPAAIAPSGSDVTWRVTRPMAANGWLVVGEAAEILDPASGQGVLAALTSGMAGARTILAAMRTPERSAEILARFDGWMMWQAARRRSALLELYRECAISLEAAPRAWQARGAA